ncbi:helix-turn-helix domain-containing protein [Microlunatus flavus]|uniref:helix-turn-helix domain-containing protein n=1 Tax=Microlunatus flavus TaxID=1036181 RepID=UPI000B855FFD
MPKGSRLPADIRRQLGAELSAEYAAGASIRQLCSKTGYSITRMRGLLIEAGVEFRSNGRRKKSD